MVSTRHNRLHKNNPVLNSVTFVIPISRGLVTLLHFGRVLPTPQSPEMQGQMLEMQISPCQVSISQHRTVSARMFYDVL